MLICGHSIADSQIIGIGPLVYSSEEKKVRDMVLYTEVCYYFDLHLKHHTTRISSETVKVYQLSSYNEKSDLQRFERGYYEAKEVILNIIEA